MQIKDILYCCIIIFVVILAAVINVSIFKNNINIQNALKEEHATYLSQIDSLGQEMEDIKAKSQETITALQEENKELKNKITLLETIPVEVLENEVVEKVETPKVEFICDNLKIAVEDALGIKDPNISDMATLIKLYAPQKNINSLIGLEYATNLVEIDIHKNKICKIDPISNCKKLRKLVAHENLINDISCLEKLPDIEELSLGWNPIKDISVIPPKADKLTRLGLGTIKIQDPSWIWRMKNLEHLVLRETGISNINGIQNLQKLKTIILFGNNIRDFRPLLYLSTLREWDIRKNPISSDIQSDYEQRLTNIKNSNY